MNSSSRDSHTGSETQRTEEGEMGRYGAGSSADPPQSPRQTNRRVKVYPERPNRVRAKKPKTRSGCKTCKIRRVKCDETKPSCQRCTKFGVSCDGYLRPTAPASAKALKPSHSYPAPISILPMTALFKDQEEYQYWLYFRDEIAHELSGHAPSKCWNYVILQACNNSPTLRHLTVAIAALGKFKYHPGTSRRHQQFAVTKYGQALRSIRELITSSDDAETIRTTLIATLLIFSFESMLGNTEQAIEYAKSSLKMMKKRLDTSNRKYSQIRRLSSIPGLEDEVLEVFVRLDNTIMSSILGDPYRPRYSYLDIAIIDEHFYMPPSFQDLIEAKGYLEHFQFRAMPYLSHLTDTFMYGDKFACPVPESVYRILDSQLKQWYKSFDPIFTAALRPGDSNFIGAATLRCLALGTDISVQRVCLNIENRPKKLFEAEARELVDLTRRVVSDPRFKKSFGFDCGIVPALFIAIMICRDREIREEAIEILRMAKGRVEVVWDASKVAELGEKMLKAEEQGETVLAI
ncbi:hypothetical protein N431DRAFT_414528 [Stipitochalara longipes BDJ]|nr:hypothetical protein N431DRAFT_414528 [Stipitochalara longipes BDJ]